MAVETDIEQKVIDLFKADDDFDDVELFIRGVGPYIVPQMYYPLCEVFIVSVNEDPSESGMDAYAYQGIAQFSVLVPENISPVARVATMASHDAAITLACAAKLKLNSEQDLDGLNSAGEQVMRVDVSSPTYNISQRARPDNWENMAQVQFVVHTLRPRS